MFSLAVESRGYPPVAVCKLLIAETSLVAEHSLPGPGIEPTSPALAGGFFTTETPEMPSFTLKFVKVFTSSEEKMVFKPC